MDRPALNDDAVFPDDVVLSRQLGKAKPAWDAFMAMLRQDYPQFSAEWRYYNDGKSWLCKVMRKDKTICWASVWDRYFRTTFYLSSRAEPLVRGSSLDCALKEGFVNLPAGAKFRHICVDVRFLSALKSVKELIEIKLQAK
jgi:hypothetical protein